MSRLVQKRDRLSERICRLTFGQGEGHGHFRGRVPNKLSFDKRFSCGHELPGCLDQPRRCLFVLLAVHSGPPTKSTLSASS